MDNQLLINLYGINSIKTSNCISIKGKKLCFVYYEGLICRLRYEYVDEGGYIRSKFNTCIGPDFQWIRAKDTQIHIETIFRYLEKKYHSIVRHKHLYPPRDFPVNINPKNVTHFSKHKIFTGLVGSTLGTITTIDQVNKTLESRWYYVKRCLAKLYMLLHEMIYKDIAILISQKIYLSGYYNN